MIIPCQFKKYFLAGFTGLETKVIVKKHEQNTRLTLTKSVCSTIRNAECVRAERPGKHCSNLLEGQRGKSCLNWQHTCPPDELSAQNIKEKKKESKC